MQQLIYTIYILFIMSKKTKKIQNKDDFEKSGFKDIIEDMEHTKDKALESVPKIRKEQVPSGEEISKDILYGDGENNNE
jgi:hypothetical protein